MKDAVLTIRLPAATRRRIEAAAEAEGRSLSQQVERLIELGFAASTGSVQERAVAYGPRSLAGILAGSGVTTLEDWREVRSELSASLLRRAERLECPEPEARRDRRLRR
jgi:hypothetical protein